MFLYDRVDDSLEKVLESSLELVELKPEKLEVDVDVPLLLLLF